MRTYSLGLKTISAVVLFFFVWSFGPVYAPIAWAAAPEGQGSSSKGQGNRVAADFSPRESAGERFEKALDSIREKISTADEKAAKDQDITAEDAEVKKQRTEIEKIDVELRKEFSATEKKLKDANLPKEILARHYKFVKHYNDNLKQLKSEITGIEKAKTKSARKLKIEQAKAHLEKVKSPKKHVPLDPNKLPFRTVKGKERAPRLKKEEFEKDFPPQRIQRSPRTASNPPASPFAKGGQKGDLISAASRFTPNTSRVLLAYNDIASDVPFALPRPSGDKGLQAQNSLFSVPSVISVANDVFLTDSILNHESGILNLAQASTVDLPTAADLAETPEVQFTPAIRAKAQDELGCNPTKIFNWVRNNIFYEAYYGSFKSAEQTLLEGAGNDFDQASLLISLMRVCNIAAKYAYGTVEIPAEKAANMVGVSDPTSAATILATQGIPVKLVISGGTVKALQLERVWVESWIDYFPSWGARHKQGGEDTWIPLDPSFKQYTYKQGMDMYAEMGFNAEDFLMSYITDTRDITAYQDYGKRLVDFIDANYPDATIEQVFGASEIKATKNIIMQEFPHLLGTLPYKTIVRAAQFSRVPPSKDYAITIQIEGNALDGTPGLNYSGYLSHLADNRVTVSYDPATSTDEALVAQYGGNILAVPPYLLSVKPVLKIAGSTVATGVPIGLGQDQNIIISFAGPDGDTDRIQNIITAGAYSAIILQSQTTPLTTPANNMAKLVDSSKKVDMPDIALDDLLGQMLFAMGVSYFHNLSIENELYAKTLQLVNLRQPAEAMVTYGVKVNYFFGIPRSLVEGNINIDVDRNINVVVSPTQDNERVKAFMILSGLSSSAWENRILEGFFDIPSVSAVRLLKLASENSIPIYTINNTNLNETLPQLQVGGDVKTDIANAVNAGKKVIVSKTNITYNQWSGVGYIIIDPITGAAGYMISGGLAGSNGSRVPQNSWFTKYSFVNAMVSPVQRRVVVLYATTKLWTPYDFGCDEGGLDCSGLTYKAYQFVGIKDFPRGARDQYSYVSQRYGFTDQPLFGDLVFFHGTYDSNRDGVVDERDKSHVGIYVNETSYIAAQGSRGTNFYLFDIVTPNGAWAARHFDAYGIVIP